MLKFAAALAATTMLASAAHAQQPGEANFRALYKELVETNTTFSAGSCTLAAERMAARLKAAGFADSDLTLFTPPDKPKDGGLVAVLAGKDPKAKAILLLAHIDVVEAKREDWERDPFTLVEENGYFYARGASDDKAQAAIWTDLLIRLKQEGYKPRRALKVALTCGEEGGGQVNGAAWLAENRRDLIDAAFALNEGAGGALDSAGGKPVVHNIQAGEKTSSSFRLEAVNPGGHSSRPVPDNAIYQLARAIDGVAGYTFPVQMNDTTRAYFTKMAPIVGGATGAAMTAIVANPKDAAADATLSKDANYNAILRTTCVATQISGGHAQNALPQRANATINCRIFPGESPAAVRDALVKAIGDAKVEVSQPSKSRGEKTAPPLTAQVVGPIEKISAQMWPGIPVVPVLQAGGTDAGPLIAVGIPTYGVSGIFYDPDLGRLHGLNERIGVKSLLDAREFSYRLVKLYAEAK
ncbi:MAG: M20/M25/M40 family metallo-hydrolase [Alphaproteobacteria bacterium]|nr:M20/M25/M40 family metallo-hydrolase [Alphaproteobacteria bacterium]MBU1512731.1 M20/M25/M40 family metallo-hydrolase [Alphaproteobacteria bacterium]MBU2096110.1 M20/M25/M40 family metallo-hydrolase [Alphaproteobacteria bacterium]MBU2152466.1 M20/M25/M40 family metallo-hydrolase [Alphaproteobacteria bacterium]MBU2308000.1 M20/M25/M40 family metallo-hydrolase [Alphaproteobacteria bacterium]